ncbi:MAG: Ribonuclease Y [Parcubacteria group bacterium GW2011_GWA2_56_7]|nr:MAG: Ribonuclease Y [Parcubacteria group bacterium GW2011_GWA2_56_7]
MIVLLVVGILFGGALGYVLRVASSSKKTQTAELEAEKRIKAAEAKEQDVLVRAKEKALAILDEARTEEKKIQSELQATKKRVEEREEAFAEKLLTVEKKSEEFDRKRELLVQKKEEIEKRAEEVEQMKTREMAKLEEVAGLSKEEALRRMEELVEKTYGEALESRIRKMEDWTEDELERKSREILSLAVTRFAASVSVDTTTSSIELPSDEMKGRIIGKEGRNIKAIENLTGTEIIVDETPNMITISCFSPIRRQVARIALENLIKDGRIHPARIEEAVRDAKKNLAREIRKAGEDALVQLGIPVGSIDPKLVQILGRLKYRTSYGQNALQHSIEVAEIAGLIAGQIGADAFNCKKGGLFHDIGKAVDHDMQGAHPEIGYNIMKKFGWPEELCYQSIAHHEDRPRTIEGAIVKAADAISGARPGARKSSLEQYIQRMEALEKTAASFEGVEKVYAIQAGREVRVFVEPKAIDDLSAFALAQNVASKIEAELQYPGEVKVVVIRETRAVEFAR